MSKRTLTYIWGEILLWYFWFKVYVKFNINLNLIFCELKESIAGREHCCGKKTQIDTYPENLRKIPVHFHKNWNDQEKRLWVGETEVGVVYMRCGYHPDQYPTQRSISLMCHTLKKRKKDPNTPSLESGTRDWWWRGPWLSSLPASTTTSPAPRRWSFLWRWDDIQWLQWSWMIAMTASIFECWY